MNYKFIFPVSGLSIVIIVSSIFLLGPITDSDNSNESERREQQAIEIVQSYKGTDGKGENMLDVLRRAFNEVYPGQDIFLQPDTKIFWFAFEDLPFS